MAENSERSKDEVKVVWSGYRPVSIGLGILLLVGAIVWISRIISGPQTNVNSPVVVRGGSMTAFTSDKWVSTGVSGPPYCSNADTSYIGFENAAESQSVALSKPNLQWEIDIRGHDYTDHLHGQKTSSYGWTLVSQPNPCRGGQGTSVVINAVKFDSDGIPTPYPNGFYPPELDLPHDTYHNSNLRFRDYSSPGCMVVDPHNGYDPDFCERMAEVRILVGITPANPRPAPFAVHPCADGDCSVSIGAP